METDNRHSLVDWGEMLSSIMVGKGLQESKIVEVLWEFLDKIP